MITQLVRTLTAEWFERVSFKSYMEPIYRDLFRREIEALGVADKFYPVGGAANHGMLYALVRIMRQSDIASVLEFGAGQTTLLLHEIAKAMRRPANVTTIENDAGWAQEVERQTGCPIHLLPLQPMRLKSGKQIVWYHGLKDAIGGCKFDLIIVDGPYAASRSTRWNRHGFLSVLDEVIGDDFIIVMDDSHRPGEWKMTKLAAAALATKGIEHYIGVIKSGKFQTIIVSAKYKRFAYI